MSARRHTLGAFYVAATGTAVPCSPQAHGVGQCLRIRVRAEPESVLLMK